MTAPVMMNVCPNLKLSFSLWWQTLMLAFILKGMVTPSLKLVKGKTESCVFLTIRACPTRFRLKFLWWLHLLAWSYSHLLEVIVISSWILISCQLHRVISGWRNNCISRGDNWCFVRHQKPLCWHFSHPGRKIQTSALMTSVKFYLFAVWCFGFGDFHQFSWPLDSFIINNHHIFFTLNNYNNSFVSDNYHIF